MSKEKFTKGEWLHDYEGAYHSVWSGEFNHPVAIIHNQDDVVDFDESDANAHLIAKAPEMYAMLKSVYSELAMLIDEVNDQRASRVTSTTEYEPDYHDQETLHLIQMLLAEARGEK